MNTTARDIQAIFESGSLGGLPDGQLLVRFVARREEAVFEAIIHRHGPMVWGVCRRVLRDRHDAEDAFQATFLVLARRVASLADGEKLGNWLYGVAYQTSMKARAMRAKRRLREGRLSDVPEPEAVGPGRPDDRRGELDRELSRLPEKYRIPVVLCELEGMTHREVAERLGWPIGTVSGRLSRARAILAKRLSRRAVPPSGVSLAVLLAQESASASVPAHLIGPTARAASLIAAGRAATAGVVSAGVASLTKEVMKMMLLSKIKVATAIALGVVLACGVIGGTGLGRVRANPPQERKGTDGGEKRAPTSPPAVDQQELQDLDRKELRETLLGLEKAGWDSLKEKGAASVTLADDFVAVMADDGRLDRAGFVKLLADLTVTDYSLSDVALTRMTPDAAVLTYRAKTSYAYKGEASKDAMWVSSGWARRGGKWVNVLYHESRMKK